MTCVVHDKQAKKENREGKVPKVWPAVLRVTLHYSDLNVCHGNSCCEITNGDKSRPRSLEKVSVVPRDVMEHLSSVI